MPDLTKPRYKNYGKTPPYHSKYAYQFYGCRCTECREDVRRHQRQMRLARSIRNGEKTRNERETCVTCGEVFKSEQAMLTHRGIGKCP